MGADSIWTGSGRYVPNYEQCPKCCGPARDMRSEGIETCKLALDESCLWASDNAFWCRASLGPEPSRAVEGS